MSESSDQGEKVHDPTPQKLEEARRKGDIPRSTDASAAAGIIGLFVAISAFGEEMLLNSSAILATMLDRTDTFIDLLLKPGGLDLAMGWVNATLAAIIPVFLLPIGCVLMSLFAQQSFAASTEKIIPKLNRLDIISNAKNKFGPTGLVQFTSGFVKITLITFILTNYLFGKTDELIGIVKGDERMVAVMMLEILKTVIIVSCVIFSIIGLVDLIWQRFDHARKLRMSYQDIKDEHKNSEGDPHTKQQRQRRGQEIATNRMLLDVPDADVIIVNPTHFAVALKWEKQPGTAPECVAKGTDEVAAKIREVAATNGVPIHRDAGTARAIYATVEIGQEIEVKHYKAVAAAINFAETIRKKSKAKSWS